MRSEAAGSSREKPRRRRTSRKRCEEKPRYQSENDSCLQTSFSLQASKLSHHNSALLGAKICLLFFPCFLCQRWPVARVADGSCLSSEGQFIIFPFEKESHRHKRKGTTTATMAAATTTTRTTTSVSACAISSRCVYDRPLVSGSSPRLEKARVRAPGRLPGHANRLDTSESLAHPVRFGEMGLE